MSPRSEPGPPYKARCSRARVLSASATSVVVSVEEPDGFQVLPIGALADAPSGAASASAAPAASGAPATSAVPAAPAAR